MLTANVEIKLTVDGNGGMSLRNHSFESATILRWQRRYSGLVRILIYLVVCAMRTSIGFPLTALAIFVTIVFTSAGTGPDGISAISRFIA